MKAFFALFLGLSLTIAHAAPITWDAPFNITSVSGISTNGTPVEARNATNDGNSPTVNVGGENITFVGFNPGVAVTSTGTFYTGGGGDTGDGNLNTVLNSHAYSGSAWSFQLTGLSNGTEYQIQVIGGGDTRGCCSGRNQRAGDGEPSENVSGDYSRSGVGSVIGTFTASGTTQTIRILNGITNGQDPSMSGYILRETTPVPPSDPTDIALSNTSLAPNTSSGTAIGTFTTTDPNPADTHSYSLVSTGSFPDNTLFSIVGGELRAAAPLGGFGSNYQIRVRTTDNTARTYDETFNLSTEAAQAPVAVNFGSTTVLQGAPVGDTVGTFSTIDANSADAHTYTLVSSAGDADNGSFTIVGNELRTAAPMPGLGAVLTVRVRSTDLSGLWVEGSFQLTVVNTSVRINEFLADNTSDSFPDEDGDTPDWIEIHNPAGGTVNLNGWYLTDNPLDLTKWQFPNVSIPGNGFLVVFASLKDRTPTNGDPLHTNFILAQTGEYLALVAADGSTVISEFGPGGTNYPNQRAGITYGFFGSPLQIGYMFTPTPEAANDASSGVLGFVGDTEFDIDRGFYNSPFNVTITTSTPGASIRYTTDGSWPTDTTGTLYTGPVFIDRTLPLKAIAYKAGFEPSNVDTQTYIFIDTVVAQTSGNTQSTWGFPSSWDGQSPYYGMNNNSNINPLTHPTIKNDLVEIPTLAISMDSDDLFGSSGIYSHPQSTGQAWERLTSLELIDPAFPDGSNDFQLNCAIRIQGGAFRSFGLTRKKSFRVLFKGQYGTSALPTGGPGTLSHDLFGPDATDKFQTLVFRMESNDGWQWSGAGGQPQYARDQFGRSVQEALGQPASHGRFCHVYLNGVYWGVYNLVERPDSSFAESYLGADRALWQGQNSGNPINDATNINDWNTMKGVVDDISAAGNDAQRDTEYLQAYGFNSNGTRNPSYPIWIDATNFIDYLIVNWYGGNSDWPQKNYYCGRAQEPDSTGFKFFMWDAEWSLFLRSGTTTDKSTDFRGVAAPQEHLAKSPEYQVRFGDRLHRALFNDGPLTPVNARAIYDAITAQHANILNPEAARWGDQHGGDRNVPDDWQPEYNNIVNNWFPVRSGIFLNQMRTRNLYPDLDAPTYSQHGGSVSAGSGPTLSVPGSVTKIYYLYGPGDADLTDYEHSLDPRLVGGGINPAATLIDFGAPGGGTNTSAPLSLDSPGFLFSRSYNSATGEWSALNTALFTIDSVPADASNIVISEIHYHPNAPSPAEMTAGFLDQDQFEFLEVMNISGTNVDMTNVDFIAGLEFVFSPGFTLAPGARAIIVKDLAAFNFRYPGFPATQIAGTFLANTGLSNNGEVLTMRAANGGIIKSFEYSDLAPWPLEPDGTGPSLVLISPSANPAHGTASNWRGSDMNDGNPGTTDATMFAGDPNQDLDEDGLTALVEHALGTSDSSYDAGAVVVGSQSIDVGGNVDDYLTVTFPRDLRAEDATITPQASTDLADWMTGPVTLVLVSEVPINGYTRQVTYRASEIIGDEVRLFIRLLVETP